MQDWGQRENGDRSGEMGVLFSVMDVLVLIMM